MLARCGFGHKKIAERFEIPTVVTVKLFVMDASNAVSVVIFCPEADSEASCCFACSARSRSRLVCR